MTLTVRSPRAGLAAVVLALLLVPAPASARQGATFAVDPQGATSARGYYVFDAAGGAILNGQVRIANIGGRTGVARLDAVDAATGATTGAVYRSREEQRWDVGAWTALDRPTVRLRPQRSAIVHFTVRVPPGAGAGDHLGGIVVEDAAAHDGGEVRRGRGRFRINVRSQTIVAVQVRVRGARRPSLALTALAPGGSNGRQTLLLGVRNDGNVLVKGRGRLTVTDAEGNRVQDARFPVDTFVARTGIQLPVAVEGRVLPAGRYRAVAELRYAGRTTRREFGFAISDRQVGQVYRSRPDLIAPDRPVLSYALGGAALALAGFTLAAALFRRPRRRSERQPAESRSGAEGAAMLRRATAIAGMALGLALVAPAPSAHAALGLFNVSGGTFNLTLDGTDRTPTYSFRLVMSNPSPYDNGGYHLITSAPDLSDGASHTLAPGVIQSVLATCFSSCAGAPSNSTGYPLAIPTGAPVTFFNAAAGTGLGNYNVIPTVRVDVPANTHAGSYTTTITAAVVAGP